MNWTSFITYSDSYQEAFETLCNQLFERYLRRTYKDDLVKFRVINGAGGDGGIEAYGELKNGEAELTNQRQGVVINNHWRKITHFELNTPILLSHLRCRYF